MPKCKSCGASILWLVTENGKKMPVNAKPVPYKEKDDGNLTLVTSKGRVVKGVLDVSSDEVGYISHFATCPQANEWRK
jgi:hypothetical protein